MSTLPTDSSQGEEMRGNFPGAIQSFAEKIESILVSVGPVAAAMNEEIKENSKLFTDILDRAEKIYDEDKSKPPSLKLSIEDRPAFKKLLRAMNRANTANILTLRSLLMTMVSQYDAFLASLLRETYVAIPGKIDSSGKTFTLSELGAMGGVEEARERIIEDEIEDFLRKSHAEQLVRLTKDYNFSPNLFKAEYSAFVEAAQRRHLFVHNDGVVNRRYLEKCKEGGCSIPDDAEVGKRLGSDSEYLVSAAEAIYSVGLKVGFGVWLQIYKGDGVEAGELANALALELISNERYSLAIKLIEYALINPKAFNDRLRRCLVLNLAQAYKWNGENTRALKTVDENDWSAMPDDLKIGELLIREEFSAACAIVRKLAQDQEWDRQHYEEWPIFREFVKQQEFLEVYRDAYSEDFLRKVTSAAVVAGAQE
ncbi:MAG: hypothetical protein EOP04_09280, partial [Proteobacteria bacterium]